MGTFYFYVMSRGHSRYEDIVQATYRAENNGEETELHCKMQDDRLIKQVAVA